MRIFRRTSSPASHPVHEWTPVVHYAGLGHTPWTRKDTTARSWTEVTCGWCLSERVARAAKPCRHRAIEVGLTSDGMGVNRCKCGDISFLAEPLAGRPGA